MEDAGRMSMKRMLERSEVNNLKYCDSKEGLKQGKISMS